MFTTTLTCTAAPPTMAGTIRRRMRCRPGCDQSKPQPERRSRRGAGWATARAAAARRPAPRRWPCPRCARCPGAGPARAPAQFRNATEPTLNNVEARAGTPNWLHAFSMPMACAASATSSRNGNMMRVMVMASSNFPGIGGRPSRRQKRDQRRANATPSAHTAPTTRITAVPTRLASSAASLRPLVARYCEKVGTNAEESAPSANRSRVRFGIRKPSENAS